MIKLWMQLDPVKDVIGKCEELNQYKRLDHEDLDILLCYNEILINICQRNIKKIEKELINE